MSPPKSPSKILHSKIHSNVSACVSNPKERNVPAAHSNRSRLLPIRLISELKTNHHHPLPKESESFPNTGAAINCAIALDATNQPICVEFTLNFTTINGNRGRTILKPNTSKNTNANRIPKIRFGGLWLVCWLVFILLL
jgi:hypothetical protein